MTVITATTLPSGIAVVNATPHSITFRHGDEDVTVPPCGYTVSARAVETSAMPRLHARREEIAAEAEEIATEEGALEHYSHLRAIASAMRHREVACAIHGVALVTTVFESTPAGLAELAAIEAACPEALIVGSIVSAQAYPGRVVAMTPAPGFERVAPAEKRMSAARFTTF